MQAVIGANMLGQLLDLQERRDFGMMQLVPRSLCVHAGQQVMLSYEKKSAATGDVELVLRFAMGELERQEAACAWVRSRLMKRRALALQ